MRTELNGSGVVNKTRPEGRETVQKKDNAVMSRIKGMFVEKPDCDGTPERRTEKFTENLLLTVSSSPHIRGDSRTRRIMADVLVALTPALIWGVYVFGWRVLTLTIVSVACCVLFELWYQLLARRPVTVTDLSAVVTGLLIAFNLPAATSLWVPAAGAFFAIVVVKQLFGGIGKNVVNPALAARIFIFTSWPREITVAAAPFTKLSASALTVDAVASATPLASLKAGALPDATVFDMLIGNIGGAIGEVSALLLIAGGLYLLVRRVITWHIPVSFIGTVALLTFIFPRYPSSAEFMLYEVLGGSLMLGAIFMATDYTTSPVTAKGRLIFGCGCGLITVFIRYFGGYAEGVSFAVMIMNLLVWYIDRATKPVRFGGAQNDARTKK